MLLVFSIIVINSTNSTNIDRIIVEKKKLNGKIHSSINVISKLHPHYANWHEEAKSIHIYVYVHIVILLCWLSELIYDEF